MSVCGALYEWTAYLGRVRVGYGISGAVGAEANEGHSQSQETEKKRRHRGIVGDILLQVAQWMPTTHRFPATKTTLWWGEMSDEQTGHFRRNSPLVLLNGVQQDTVRHEQLL